jgi:hypothetical protein
MTAKEVGVFTSLLPFFNQTSCYLEDSTKTKVLYSPFCGKIGQNIKKGRIL